MPAITNLILTDSEDLIRVEAVGIWTATASREAEHAIGRALARPAVRKPVIVDLGGLTELDTYGAWLIERMTRALSARGGLRGAGLMGDETQRRKAVALRYDAATSRAPVVLAKGTQLMAQRIREIAEEHRIPIITNPPLCRAIYKAVRIGQEITPDLYEAVAEILAFVYRLRMGGLRRAAA